MYDDARSVVFLLLCRCVVRGERAARRRTATEQTGAHICTVLCLMPFYVDGVTKNENEKRENSYHIGVV